MSPARAATEPAKPLAAGAFPAKRPETGVPLHGWMNKGTARLLCSAGRRDAKTVVELGSWMGRSALFLAGAYPHATIYCIDVWRGYVDAMEEKDAPLLYDAFLEHTWPHRERIVPVRADTVGGMESLAQAGVQADLVYIDADHSTEGCLRDLRAAHRLFPDARLVGDDWWWPTVRKAVRAFAREAGMVVQVDRSGWRLHRRAPLGTRVVWAWRRAKESRKRRGLDTIQVPKVGA